MDTLTPQQRSERMRLIKSSHTKPELKLRKLIWSLGHRYRVNRRDIPGKPDLAFTASHRVIFVHGCFWHRHDCSNGVRIPRSRVKFWTEKFRRNVKRDVEVRRQLRSQGWRTLVIWECELQNSKKTERRIKRFFCA